MEASNVIASIAVVISLIAALVAWIVPHRVEKLRQEATLRELKLDTLRRAIGLRAQPPTREWLNALNEIAVVFNDAPQVLALLVTFESHIRTHGGHSNQLLVDLFTAMMENLNLTRSGLDGEFLLRPFGGTVGQH